MRTPILALLLAGMTLTACGSIRDSGLNPFNWFGRSRAETLPATGPVNPLIPTGGGLFSRRGPAAYTGTPVAVIKDLVIERAAGGAIIRVKAVADRQGPFEVRLIKDDDAKDGTLSYTLKALQTPTRLVGPETAREIVAAKFVTDGDLAGIRTIRVKGAKNARSTSRRY